tara:strand:+ start:175 stop:396 length:222 start_codon:yes stop_codon:yes gene_type:complete
MKVNIPIELNEEERKTLGVALHGKVKAITRKEVVSIVDQLIHYLANKNYDSIDGSIGWTLNFYPKTLIIKDKK